MRNFVIINGVNSNTINGLGINELPPITKPEMRNIREEIDGRDGDIITPLCYGAYDKTITIGLFGTGYDINDIVAFFNGEGTIVFSNEPDKYYNFKILNQIDYESLQKFKTASITFHCQPFKYPLTETPLEIEYDYIEDEDETLTLNNTASSYLELDLKGNTSQSGTPTPTSPIPVSVVSGDNEVVVCGKNLLPQNKYIASTTVNGITFTNNGDGTFNLVGTASANATIQIIPIGILQLEANQPYYLYSSAPYNSTTFNISIAMTDNGSTKFILANNTYTPTATPTNERLQFYIASGQSVNQTNIKMMLVKGTTPPTPYKPYTSQTYEVDLPVENMLDNSKTSSTSGVLTTTYLGGTRYRIQGLTTGNKVFMTGLGIPTGNYTISITLVSGSYSGGNLVIQDQSNTSAGEITIGALGVKKSVSISNKNIGRLILWNTQTFDGTFDIQIEPGTKANSYTEYGTTPIELCKIGTYQDYFTKNSDGEWCKYNAIGKVVLDGSESSWGKSGASTSSIFVGSLSISNLNNKYATGMSWLTNRFSYSNTLGSAVGCFNTYNGSAAAGYGNLGLSVDANSIPDLATFKTWLSNNNTIVYYILNTPYLSLIEDNNLIEQLNELQNAMSYEGTTNIGQVNNDKAFIISAKALEKGSNEVVVNNIGNVYSKPLLALEGSGNVDIYLDNTQILKANVEDKMNIDIAQLEAYNPDTMTLLNRQVIGNYNSMTLQPGNNTIRIDGALDKATITNYTRWL